MTRAVRRRRTVLPAVLAVMALAVLVPSAAAAAPRYPTQDLGDHGTDVKALQWLLGARGFPVTVDGVFGEATRTAVMAWETSVGLPADGVVDDAAWTKLVFAFGPGTTGPAVKALEAQLKAKRHLLAVVDTTWGTDTTAAVKAFQRHVHLTPSGRINGATWRRLIAHFELPSFNKTSLCDYSVGNGKANWGTSAAINQLEAAARIVGAAGHGRVAVGDIGLEHGGVIAGHETHRRGLDVDIRPMRKAEDQCRWGGSYRAKTYDRAATRALVQAIRQTAPGHVKLIYFNDPVLIREGLTTRFTGHDDHLHVRYCERTHPFAKYAC